MKRPPLSEVDTPRQEPGRDLPSLMSWAASAARAIKALATRQADHANAIDQMAQGHGICRGSVTLRASQTTTTVTDDFIPADALVFLQAGTGTWTTLTLRVSAVAKGTFTITHSSEAAIDRVVFWHVGVAG